MLEINATSIAIVLNFIVLVFILNYFLYGPVRKIMEDRRKYVLDSISQAEAKNKEGEVFLEEGKQSVEKANVEAKNIIKKATSAAEKIKKDQKASTAIDIDEMKKRAKEEIAQFKAEAKKQMMDDTARLSVIIAEKIMRKKLGMSSQRAMIDSFIRKLEK